MVVGGSQQETRVQLPGKYYTHEKIQMKTTSVAAAYALVGLNIHKGKSRILKYNRENINSTHILWRNSG
ncbi:unnamed protein product [Schistosoma margrebowiei]|uniref:Uncharacterized protein n=1 Tax=Schistosoma margrebowiei TaxID=48269 RepID=A0A183MVP9_9TREM|nr:unnamed protein product [Schistosoma margrebowiei]